MTNRLPVLFVKNNTVIWCKVSDRTVLMAMWSKNKIPLLYMIKQLVFCDLWIC